MSSRQVEVIVRSGGKMVDGPLLRPVRLLPDATAGVVYGGGVYPLHTNDRVDLEDAPVDKWLCPSFVMDWEPIPYAKPQAGPAKPLVQISSWYLETNKHGHYLVFDASEAAAAAVVDLMVQRGLGVRRWDASHRPSADGVQYDWFIRLEFSGSRDECLERVGTAIVAAVKSAAAPGGAVPGTTQRPAVDDGLALKVEILKKALTVSEGSHDRALASAETAKGEARNALEQLRLAEAEVARLSRRNEAVRSKEKALRAEVLEVREELARARQPIITAVDDELLTRLQDSNERLTASEQHAVEAWLSTQAQVEALEDENRRLISRNQSVESAVGSLRQQLSEAERRLAEAADERREASVAAGAAAARSPRRREPVHAFLQRLCPRIILSDDSVEELLSFTKPLSALQVLLRLQDEDATLPKMRVKGGERLWEVGDHINTGDAGNYASGRVYYNVVEDGRLEVHVQRKKDDKAQERFLKQLKRSA